MIVVSRWNYGLLIGCHSTRSGTVDVVAMMIVIVVIVAVIISGCV